jgi:hypothetical protein
MKSLFAIPLTAWLFVFSFSARCQYMEKVVFNAADSTGGYYLAIPPASNTIRGTLVFFCAFRGPESILPETRLHNVASANDLLTIYASVGTNVTANPAALARINAILLHVIAKYRVDTSFFALGGYDIAGTTLLRYTEQAYQHPSSFALRPAAVFAVSSFVDLSGFYHSCERQIKKKAFPPRSPSWTKRIVSNG